MQRVRALVVLAVLAGASVFASSASAVPLTDVTLPSMPVQEAEPNNDTATAQAIDSGDRVRGNTNPRTDQDWYAFDATGCSPPP